MGVVVLVAACVAFALAGPRLDIGFVHDADGLGWLPAGVRSTVDDARGRPRRPGAQTRCSACLDGGEVGLWTSSYTTGNPLDDDDVVTLTADVARPPVPAALAAAALAADNHLAPWVEVIELRVGAEPLLIVDRTGHAHDQPQTDAAALRPAARGAPEWLTTVAPEVDRRAVLDCSARTPL